MLRHRIIVQAPLANVFDCLNQTDFVTAQVDEALKIVQLSDGIGTAREVDAVTTIDLFDESDDGFQVGMLLECLTQSEFTWTASTSRPTHGERPA